MGEVFLHLHAHSIRLCSLHVYNVLFDLIILNMYTVL